jgi:tetratricopeptide (TPR) repeat protein
MARKAKTNKKSNAPEKDNKEIKAQEEALKIRTADGSHVEVADLNDQVEIYYKQGKYTEAEPLYVQALVISEKTLGPDHPDTEKVREKLETLRNDELILEISNYESPEKERKEAILKEIIDLRKGFHREK